MITKTDYAIAALVGFLVGTFAIPTLVNSGFRNHIVLISLPLIAAILFVFGMWLGKFLSRWLPFMAQFAKFAAVGFLNTAIDFGVLNLLSILTGVTAGLILGGVNVPGFALAVSNAYVWNKFWVFRGQGQAGGKDFLAFLAVSVGGLLLNSAIVVSIVPSDAALNARAVALGVEPKIVLQVAKAAATGAALFWNFIGYKFIVFKKKDTGATPLRIA